MKTKLQKAKETILAAYGREPETMDELAECVIAVINNQCQNNLVGFEWEIVYREKVSNSHYAPVGHPTNFGSKPGIPTSYPGWAGRVWVRYRDDIVASKMWSHSPLSAALTHTGTGGSGCYNGPWVAVTRAYHTLKKNKFAKHSPEWFKKPECFSWDYKIFEYDWPLISENLEKEKVVLILSDKNFHSESSFAKHRYHWVDSETALLDQQLLAEVC